ncbi:MAG: S-layer homology domain-containing protein [Oscillospiraceae bacterium]|jgi:hypothetical protein|nr:S-layer homology domain-containing protein [Oscillospiraceae bacterium]
MKFSKQARSSVAILLVLVSAAMGVTAVASANDTTIKIGDNYPPIATNLTLSTFRDVPVTGEFSAIDPDGDAVTFEVTSKPKRGTVELGNGGMFTYKPSDGAKGKDSFYYVAVDAAGNVSAPATVAVSVKKQSTKTTYADMDGCPAQYAALTLAERGVFTGERLGGSMFFRPDQTVTRGEFLAMCLAVSGAKPFDGVTRTGFYDDDDIQLWAKPYISTALVSGVVSGYRDGDGRLVFAPDDAITVSEAAVMLNRALGITDVAPVGAMSDDACPAWAAASVTNLSAVNILSRGSVASYDASVTRAQAAEMLLAAIELVDARNGDASLLGWAK